MLTSLKLLEMFFNRAGFRPNYEQFTLHSRRRYRLSSNPTIWLVCYRPSDQQYPVRNAPIQEAQRALLKEREMLNRSGMGMQLLRKDFMLNDSNNFPTITFPGHNSARHPQQTNEYPSNVMAHLSKNQQAAYKQQQQQQWQLRHEQGGMTGDEFGNPSKRQRRDSSLRGAPSMTAIPTSRRSNAERDEDREDPLDYMDSVTPRELAMHRYVQHHEWLEEVLSSPYDTYRIVPPQLGLGRKGELESLTRDFFDAPTAIHTGKTLSKPRVIKSIEQVKENEPAVDDVSIARVGRLEEGKAHEFEEKAASRMAKITAEIEEMQQKHAKLISSLKAETDFKIAEREMEISTRKLLTSGFDQPADLDRQRSDELLQTLEKKVGKSIKSVPFLECLEKGGREEYVVHKQVEVRDHEMAEASDESITNSYPPPDIKSQENDQSAEPVQASGAQKPAESAADTPQIDQPEAAKVDVIPESVAEPSIPEPVGDDFVLINKDDALPSPPIDEAKPSDNIDFTTTMPDHDHQVNENSLTDFGAEHDINFETNGFDDGIDFGDMDTAGDELSGYAQEIANMGGGKQDDLGFDSPTLQNPPSGFGEPPSNDGPAAP